MDINLSVGPPEPCGLRHMPPPRRERGLRLLSTRRMKWSCCFLSVSFSPSDPVFIIKLSKWGFSFRLCWKTQTPKSSITPDFHRLLFPSSSFWILVGRSVQGSHLLSSDLLITLYFVISYRLFDNVTGELWVVINSRSLLQAAVKHYTLLWSDVTFKCGVHFQ